MHKKEFQIFTSMKSDIIRRASIWKAVRAFIYFSLSVLFFVAFYLRYWKYKDCIQISESSCFTENGENLISAGMIWIFPSAILFFMGLRLVLLMFKR